MSATVEGIFTPWPYDAVARGVALLDEKVPGWRERINVEALDMGDCEHCILGQIYGDYIDGLDIVEPEAYVNASLEFEAGFDVVRPCSKSAGPRRKALAAAWRAAIVGGSK